jgi:hypothetical protein
MKHILNITAVTVILALVLVGGYSFLEPELVDAQSANTSVVVSLEVRGEISIASTGNTTMSNYLGVTNNTAIGSSTFRVITNDTDGYTLGVKASTNPAMQTGSDIIDDVATTTSPLLWAAAVGTGEAKFGFSVFSTSSAADVNTTKWGTASAGGQSCSEATSTPSTSLKYSGFYTWAGAGTTTATRAATTTTTGSHIVICYAVEQDTFFIPSGIYTATITGTAVAN